MRLVNRTVVTIVGGKPYLYWTRQRHADFYKGALTVEKAP